MAAEHERREMVEELKSAVQAIVDLAIHSHADHADASSDAGGDAAAVSESRSLTEQNPDVRRLLKSIEDVLHHQIKPPLFGHVPKVWKYLENLDKCLPGTSATLHSVREYGVSDYARVRMFIRLALNERSLSEYLSALAWNQALTTNYYKEEAILRDDESLDTVFLLLENLNKFNFALVLKDKELERPRYWELVPIHSAPLQMSQIPPEREPSIEERENSVGSAGLKVLSSIVSAVVDEIAGPVEYPAAVAPKRTKARKGRTNRRRSIALPSPPSVPRAEGEVAVAQPPDATTAEEEAKNESEADHAKSEEEEGSHDEGSSEEERGDTSREGTAENVVEQVVVEEEPEKKEDDGDSRAADTADIAQPDSLVTDVEPSDDELHDESDNDEEDTALAELLKKTQERLRQLQEEISKTSASVAPSVMDKASQSDSDIVEPNKPATEQPQTSETVSVVNAAAAVPVPVTEAVAITKDEAKPTTATAIDVNVGSEPTMTEQKAAATAAVLVKGRAKKPKRIVSIMDAGVDEKRYHEDKLKKILDEKENERANGKEKKNEDDVKSETVPLASLNRIKSVENLAGLQQPSPSPSPSPSPQVSTPQPSSLPSPSPSPADSRNVNNGVLTFTKVSGGWTPQPSSSSLSSLPPVDRSPFAGHKTEPLPAMSPATRSRFDKAALSNLLSMESVVSDEIEHHHEFYPPSAGDLYYSASYVKPSPLADRASSTSSASRWPSASSSYSAAPRLQPNPVIERRTVVAVADTMKPSVKSDSSDSDDEARRNPAEADIRAEQARDPSGFLLTIPTKRSTGKANAKCPSCRTLLAGASLLGGIRYCNYTGLYYCPRCHHNEKTLVPARIVHNWDTKEHKVSIWAKEYIESNLNRPAFNIASINPQLYGEVPALNQALTLRKPLTVIGEFVLTCKDRGRLTLSLVQAQRAYLIENTHLYSLRDLIDVSKNRFVPYLQSIIEEFVAHITSVCAVCKGKAHFCELCQDEDNLVFPFQLHRITQCDECKSYFHKACWQAEVEAQGRPCPKCERVRLIRERLQREAQREQELNLRDSFGLDSLPAYPAYKGSGGSGSAASGAGGARHRLAASASSQQQQQPRRNNNIISSGGFRKGSKP